MNLEAIAADAVALVRTCTPLVQQYFRKSLTAEYKSDASPVTLADKAIEQHLRTGISRLWPDHGIIGEEFPDKLSRNSRFCWIIDPIDGTKAFITGRTTFCTLLALCADENPVLGIIFQPLLDELWLGIEGHPTRFNGLAVTTTPIPKLASSRLATTAPDYFTQQERQRFDRLSLACALTVYGGDAYNYGLLALGHVDIVAEAGLKFHDIAALVPVVRGAGGVITNWQGAALNRLDTAVLASRSEIIAREAQAHLNASVLNASKRQ